MPSDQLALPGNDTLYVLCVYASKQRPTMGKLAKLEYSRSARNSWDLSVRQCTASNRLELVQTVRYGTDSVQASSRSMDKLVPRVI